MAFFERLWHYADLQHSLYILVGFGALAMYRRWRHAFSEDGLRTASALIIAHTIALIVAAASATGETATAYLVALGCGLLAAASVGITALFRVILPAVGLRWPQILADILTAIVLIIVLIVVGKRAGFSVAGLITTSAVLTAVIGFSLQDTLGNIMGGLALQMDRSITTGDWISLGAGQPSGRVTEIRWRYTAIETRAWETIVIPNGVLMRSQVTVIGKRSIETAKWRRNIEFFVDYRYSPNEVIDPLIASFRADPVPGMALDPEPQVLLTGYRESFAAYAVRYWLSDLARDELADSTARIRVWYALKRAGIALAKPAMAVFSTQLTPEHDQRKTAEDHANRLAAIDRVDLFRDLANPVKAQLATQLTYVPFAAGEMITHEGEREDELFMIVKGKASVRIGRGRNVRNVAALDAGDFFGEMSLLTGEPRAATVLAETECVCYRVDRLAMQTVMRSDERVAEHIAGVLAERKEALNAARDEHADARRSRIDETKQDLMSRIKSFFGADDDSTGITR